MKRHAILLAMTATIITVSACATGRWESEEIVGSRNVQVALEHRVENDQVVDQNFNQPAQIEPALIDTALGGLFYTAAPEFFGKAEDQPVFQAEEIKRLAPAISLAFQKASSSQRVRFTSFNKGGGLIFKDRRKTSGILFIDADDRLNIAFSYINRVLDYEDRIESQTSPDPEPLTIASSDTPVIANAPYLEHHMLAEGKPGPMWVKADLDELRTAATAPPAPASAPPRAPEPEGQAIEPDRQAPSSGQTAAPADWSNQKESLKIKLEYLKELYEDGLISRTEYEAKKQDLLEQIR